MKTPALYFPTLDGLRFFAFVLVLIHHLPVPANPLLHMLHEQGWVGVHIFLFLSAYLLTAILSAELQASGRISVIKFYIRRALRIWPLYFAFCIGIFALFFLRNRHLEPEWFRFLGQLFFVDNVIAGFRDYNPIVFTRHLWTISLEEQFYLFLPLALTGMLASRKRLVAGVLALWLVFLGVRIAMVAWDAPHPMIWTSVFSADSLLLGTLLGALRPGPSRSVVLRIALLVGGLVALFSGVFLPPVYVAGWHQVLHYTVIAGGAAGLTLAALNEPALAFLAARPLRYLGKISYGLYVFHLIGIEAARRATAVMGSDWWLQAAVASAVTLLLAVASYELFERHFLKLKHRFETVRSRPA